jgi:hypothetical protein
MAQVSRPLRIALVAVVVLGGAWMLVLKPKSSDVAATPAVAAVTTPVATTASAPPAVAKPAPAKAKPAKAKPAKAKPAKAKPAKAKPAKAKPAKKNVSVLAPTRATVLLFAGAGADDGVAREVVRSLRGPRVRTIISPVSRVAAYKSLTGAIQIDTTPTILLITANHARRIVGLVDRAEVQQALAAALRHP